MIGPELAAEIRRLFFAELFKVGTIVSQLGQHPIGIAPALDLAGLYIQVLIWRPLILRQFDIVMFVADGMTISADPKSIFVVAKNVR